MSLDVFQNLGEANKRFLSFFVLGSIGFTSLCSIGVKYDLEPAERLEDGHRTSKQRFLTAFPTKLNTLFHN